MRFSTRFVVPVFVCATLVPPAAVAQNSSGAASEWTIPSDGDIRRLLAARPDLTGVGIVVGILEPTGRRVVTHGRSGAADSRPLDGETVFQIGSITKVFTGLLLADMVVRGEVSLDDPASKYLPDGARMPQRGRPITLIDLSKHWSALPSMPTNFSLSAAPNPYDGYTEEQLYEFLSAYELPREPGTQSYSNLGVALLGRLLARRAGTDYETLLTQRILAPLGLRSTAISLGEEPFRRLAPGHDRFGEPVETWNLHTMPASGSLRSTANDLLTLLAASVSPDSPLEQAMRLQRTPGRALGWGRSTLGGEDVYGHEGGKEGYRSAAIFNPRTGTGVVVLTNSRTAVSPMALARHLLYRGSPLPPLAQAVRRPAVTRLDPVRLSEYEGRYRLESGAELRVMRRGDHLLVDTVGDGIQTVFPSGQDEFFSNTEDQTIMFGRAGGRVSLLTLKTGDIQQRAVRLGGP